MHPLSCTEISGTLLHCYVLTCGRAGGDRLFGARGKGPARPTQRPALMIRRELWKFLRVGDQNFVCIYSVVPFLMYKRISEENWKLLLYFCTELGVFVLFYIIIIIILLIFISHYIFCNFLYKTSKTLTFAAVWFLPFEEHSLRCVLACL
jgi:hypothetical protein